MYVTFKTKMNTINPTSRGDFQLGVTDQRGVTYVVDTGAQVSVIKPFTWLTVNSTSMRLAGIDGREVKVHGSCEHVLKLGACKYRAPFIVADVAWCVLGLDFLRDFNMLLDVKEQQETRGPCSRGATSSRTRSSQVFF